MQARIIPIFVFVIFILFFTWLCLSYQSTNLKTPLPELKAFNLSDLGSDKNVTHLDLLGEPFLMHVWASWCRVCVFEHHEVERWAIMTNLPIVGVNYQDNQQNALSLLHEKGNPYTYNLNDSFGSLGLNLGIIATPEWFLFDGAGNAQFHHVGALNEKIVKENILPIVRAFVS